MKSPPTISVFLLATSCGLAQAPAVHNPRWVDYQQLLDASSSMQGASAAPSDTISVARLRHKIPGKAMAAFSRALKLTRRREWQQGAGELQEALAIDPDFSDAHENLGVHYVMLGRTSEALPELRRAVALDPSTSSNHSNLAVAYMLQHERGQAETEAETAVALDGRNSVAQFLLGALLVQSSGGGMDARRHLMFAADVIPEAHFLLMELYRAAGETSLAGIELDRYRRAMHQANR